MVTHAQDPITDISIDAKQFLFGAWKDDSFYIWKVYSLHLKTNMQGLPLSL